MAKYLIILIPMLLLLGSCASNKNLLSSFSYESLIQGTLNLSNEEQIIAIIESKNDWKEFQENLQNQDTWKSINVDFAKENLLVLIEKEQNTPSYKTFIDKIKETDKEIEIYWKTEPKDNAVSLMVLASPYNIYKIPKTTKNLVFK